jgi:hypothetical protein
MSRCFPILTGVAERDCEARTLRDDKLCKSYWGNRGREGRESREAGKGIYKVEEI